MEVPAFPLLISPLVDKIIENYSFKDDFLHYCESKKEILVISWSNLRDFILQNGWNWEKFVRSKLDLILKNYGFLPSGDLVNYEIELTNLDDFIQYLKSLDKSILVINKDLMNHFKDIQSTKVFPEKSDEKGNVLEKFEQRTSQIKCYSTKKITENIAVSNIAIDSKLFDNESKVFEQFFTDRFQKLRNLLVDQHWAKMSNRPKLLNSLDDIEVNERVFLVGLISQKSQSSSQLHHVKLFLIDYNLKCHIVANISVSKLPSNDFPLGVAIGITGKVTNISYGKNWSNTIHIMSESWIAPSPTYISNIKKDIPTNESWVAIFGTPNIPISEKKSTHVFNTLVSWINKNHSDYRLGYIIFLGGILSNLEQFEEDFSHIINQGESNSINDYYNRFYNNLQNIPKNINIFILPNKADMTKAQIPQPAINEKFQCHETNIHFLTNPSKIKLEDKNLLLYNPFQYMSLNYYLEDPERFMIDLLNYNLLNPMWSGSKPIFQYSNQDCLLIEKELDYFLCNHPFSGTYSKFKDVFLGLAPPFNEKSIPVLIFNLHTKKHYIEKIVV